MDTLYFQHPRRFPRNADGPFYTTGYRTRENDSPNANLVWCGDCMQCEAPEAEPDLLAPLDRQNSNTFFATTVYARRDFKSVHGRAGVLRLALRYGGRDVSIIMQLQNDPEYCDYMIGEDNQLLETVDANGNFLSFAQKIIDSRRDKWNRERRRQNKKWWQFWNW